MAMVSHLFYYQIALFAIVWLFVMLHGAGARRGTQIPPPAMPTKPTKPKRNRSTEPKPFAGLTKKPHCALCERETTNPKSTPAVPPDPMPPTNRRPREIDTSQHFCPHPPGAYRGWLGLGNLRANGHPSGGPGGSFNAWAAKATF